MAYAQWHGSIVKHHKTIWLSQFLGVNRREALGIRGALIGWTIDNRPGGYVERNLLAYACDWDGDATKLESALLDSKLIDKIDDETVAIHDWHEYTKEYRKARKDAKRKRLHRKGNSKTSADSPRTFQGQSTDIPGRSDQNGAERRRTEQSGAESCAEPAKTPSAAPPSELSGLALYEADRKLCSRWTQLLPAWKKAFPGVDVMAEVRKAHTWELANPTRVKKDRPRFLNTWLSKAQDQPRPPTAPSRTDANGNTKCLNCNGTGEVPDGVAFGGGMKMVPCGACRKRAVRA